MTGELWIDVLVFIVLLFFSALSASAEVAIYSVSKLKIRNLVMQKKKGAAELERLKDSPRKVIATLLLVNNFVNTAAAAMATVVALEMFGSVGVGIATGVVTILILVFGDMFPKNFAVVNAESIALFIAKPLELIIVLLYPFVVIFEKASEAMIKTTCGEERHPLITEEDLRMMVEIGAEEKAIEEKEKEFIEGVLRFKDITVQDVMTPRMKVFCLDAEITVGESVPKINHSRFLRTPVYEGTIDKIVGIVYLKDLLKAMDSGSVHGKLRDISRRPMFVSQEGLISEVFRDMQRKHTKMAVVLDEFGGTAGIVTMEDLLSEIVGEIMDESELSPAMIMRIDKDTIVVHGDTHIEDVNDFFNTNIPVHEHHKTIAGLLHHELKRIPRRGARISIGHLELIVEETSDNFPLKVRIKKMHEVVE